MKFKHKATVIDAIQLQAANLSEVRAFMGDDFKRIEDFGGADGTITLRGYDDYTQKIPVGYWIIRGVHGEYYGCAPKVFAESYDAV